MIKNTIKTLIIGAILTSTSLFADISEFEFETKSLVGIEGGYNSIDYVYDGSSSPRTTSLPNIGLKIGAETNDFRIFLSTRYLLDTGNDYDYIVTYGGEFQYKFNPFSFMNFFIGLNTGVANIRFIPPVGAYRTISSPYFGGDLGVNIYLGKSVDLEFGTRIMSIQETNTIDNIDYRFNDIVSGYASLIFKWKMD